MSALASKTAPRDSGSEVHHHQFGLGVHDGIQYHFFAGERLFSVRVIECRGARHYSAWFYDRGVQEVVNSDAGMEKIGEDHLNLTAPGFSLETDDTEGVMRASTLDDEPVFEIDFNTPMRFDWVPPRNAGVIHQPMISARVRYAGATHEALGYCKRYWFDEDSDYLAWRFIQGEVDGRYMVWTADGNFGGDYRKYDYFKIVYANGRLAQAGDCDSYHRDESAFATVEDEQFEVRIEPLGTWSTEIRGDDTRLMLRQRFCRMKVLHDGGVDEGYALNETGVGLIR